MAIAIDLEKVFRSAGRIVDLLAELEGHDWVLGAVNDEDGCGDLFQIGLRVQLGVNKQAQAGEKPKDFAGHAGRGGERRFEDEAADYVVSGEIGGYGGP